MQETTIDYEKMADDVTAIAQRDPYMRAPNWEWDETDGLLIYCRHSMYAWESQISTRYDYLTASWTIDVMTWYGVSDSSYHRFDYVGDADHVTTIVADIVYNRAHAESADYETINYDMIVEIARDHAHLIPSDRDDIISERTNGTPPEMSLTGIAAAVRSACDTPTMICDTGGGTATLYIGTPTPNADGDDIYVAVVGPGTFESTGEARVLIEEIAWGPDNWGSDEGIVMADDTDTAETITAKIIAYVSDRLDGAA